MLISPLVADVPDSINAHYHESPPPDNPAKLFDVSKFHLLQEFKEHVDTSYLKQHRL